MHAFPYAWLLLPCQFLPRQPKTAPNTEIKTKQTHACQEGGTQLHLKIPLSAIQHSQAHEPCSIFLCNAPSTHRSHRELNASFPARGNPIPALPLKALAILLCISFSRRYFTQLCGQRFILSPLAGISDARQREHSRKHPVQLGIQNDSNIKQKLASH